MPRHFNKDNASRYGKMGGDRNIQNNGKDAVRRAGQALVQKYGIKHMQNIGRMGFWATCNKHYGGNAEALMAALHERGLMSISDQEMRGLAELYQDRFPEWFQ